MLRHYGEIVMNGTCRAILEPKCESLRKIYLREFKVSIGYRNPMVRGTNVGISFLVNSSLRVQGQEIDIKHCLENRKWLGTYRGA